MKEQIIIDMYNAKKTIKEIALTVDLTPTRINQILKKHNLKESNPSYNRRISDSMASHILSLNSDGLSITQISKLTGITPTGIKSFLNKRNVKTNIIKVDTSRPCVVCNVLFTPKYSDGVKKDRYKTCSKECLSEYLSAIKIKYTVEQINEVIELKKVKTTNTDIARKTGVDINKIKEIVKEHSLYLTPEQVQENAFNGKIKVNPNCMADMRAKYKEAMASPEELNAIKTSLLEKGYEYVSGFDVKSKPFLIKCLKCNKNRETSKFSTIQKNSCVNCIVYGSSKPEQEVMDWIKTMYPSAHKLLLENKKTRSKEIDIFIPELKIGIEYCGLYFHSDNEMTEEEADKNKHYKKMLIANDMGIRLITVFENEWLERKEQVKNFLVSILKKNAITVGARKCELVTIEQSACKTFLDQNHIQGGNGRSKMCFALLHNEEIVGAISCGMHPQRPNSSDESIYVNRLAFKGNVTVSGGASRLLNALKIWAKESGYKWITSWSDNRWSEGSVYKSLGFVFDSQKDKGRGLKDGSVWPEMHYNYGGKIYSKRKMELSGLDPSKFNKIWDCGKKRWVLNLI